MDQTNSQHPQTMGVLRPSVVVGFIYLLLLLVFSTLHGYKALDFVHLGTVWGEHNLNGTWGYDGQFYYQIAVNPFGAADFLDNAPFRYQRIIYPLVARLLALGQPNIVPYTLLVINLLAIVLSVELLSDYLRMNRVNPWFSIGYGLYFGQATALTFDTTEPFTYLLITLGIWLWSKEHLNWSALLFGIASLSRETAVLFPLGYVAYFFLQQKWMETAKFLAISILPLVCWLAALSFIFGETGVTFTPPFEQVPFAGIFFHSQTPRMFWLLVVFMLIPTIGAWIMIGVKLLQREWNPLLFVWLANALMITFMARTSYMELISCGRVATGLVLAGITYGASVRNSTILQFSQYHTLTYLVYLGGVFLGIRSLIL